MSDLRLRLRPETLADGFNNVVFTPPIEFVSSNNRYYITVNEDLTAMTFSFTAKCRSGYVFARSSEFSCRNTYGSYITGIGMLNGVLSENDTLQTFNVTYQSATTQNKPAQIYFTNFDVVQNAPTLQQQFLTYYKCNDDILNQLSKKAFQVIDRNGQAIDIDLTQYIASLRLYPFEINASDPLDIILGNYNISVKSPLAQSLYHEIDMGNVTIAPTNNNSNDYNATIKIILPFIGIQTLQATWYAGKTINLKYNVDISSGLCSATLSIDNIPVDIFTGKIGKDMPYKVSGQYINPNLVDTTIQDTYSLTAIITVLYHANYNETSIVNDYSNVTISNLLNQDIGYCEIDNLTLPYNMTKEIQDEIRQLLRNGIIL